jgi:small-conductance mechanosensitive channel
VESILGEKTWADVNSWIQQIVGIPPQTQDRLIRTILLLVVIWLIRHLARRVMCRRVTDLSRRYSLNKGINYVVGIIAIIGLIGVWVGGGGSIAAYLGIVSAGLAIALQDVISDLAGWLFVLSRRPFEVGDRIEIGDTIGDVIDIRLFQFSLLEVGNWVHGDQSSGRVVHVPNGWVFTKTLANYTQGFDYVWEELPVNVTFESDWRNAKAILAGIADRHAAHLTPDAESQVRQTARRFRIVYDKLTPVVWTRVIDFGVCLTIRFMIPPRERRTAASRIWEDVLDAFAREDTIDFAYPTTRYYNNKYEGKPGAGGQGPRTELS